MKDFIKLLKKYYFILVFLILITLSISTKYIGSTDVLDYTNPAKFFAGEYNADIRSSHSYFYGFMNAILVKLTLNFILMKFMSLVWLLLIVLSMYYISEKNKKVLLTILFAPIIWYIAPWINPIQISSLLFLWSYYFIKKYDEENKIPYLIYSGLFVGLSWVFWDTMLYFGIILSLCFLLDKKFYSYLLFLIFVFVGLTPRLILDQFLFNFAFFSIFKSFLGGITNLFWSDIAGGGGFTSKSFVTLAPTLLMIPLFSYLIFFPKNFKKDKKTSFLLLISLLLILTNPQPRYMLVIFPIFILYSFSMISDRQFKIQLVLSILICLLVITPYLIQIKYSTNAEELGNLIKNFPNIKIDVENLDSIPDESISEDLIKISNDFPNEIFVVGNHQDYYSYLAFLYWGVKVKEFVSIQDYNLYFKNQNILFEKEFHPTPNINERREIWIKGGISKSSIDNTNYTSIKYAISNEKEIDLNGFELIKSYKKLNVFKKVD